MELPGLNLDVKSFRVRKRNTQSQQHKDGGGGQKLQLPEPVGVGGRIHLCTAGQEGEDTGHKSRVPWETGGV